jgi:predicted RNA polymerase sigma factor
MGPIVRINKVRSVVGVSRYGLKGVAAMGYGLKGVTQLDAYLELNGGWLTHQSRGFFRSDAGRTLSVRGAEQRAVELFTGNPERHGSWQVVTETWLASRRAVSVRASEIRCAGDSSGSGWTVPVKGSGP